MDRSVKVVNKTNIVNILLVKYIYFFQSAAKRKAFTVFFMNLEINDDSECRIGNKLHE
tara:strand:+ start:5329 stop:5502 length:174 start_codon:yes stop_codon:yes gene_type:complete